MKIVLRLLVLALGIWVADYLLSGVTVTGLTNLAVLTIVLAVVNTIVKPVLKLITLPLNIITLGLFSVVLNAILILLVANLVPGFYVSGFVSAIWFGVVVGLVSLLFKPVTALG